MLDLDEEIANSLRGRRAGRVRRHRRGAVPALRRPLRQAGGRLARGVRPRQRAEARPAQPGQRHDADAARPTAWSRSPTTPTRGCTWCSCAATPARRSARRRCSATTPAPPTTHSSPSDPPRVVVENNHGYSSPLSTVLGRATDPGLARVDVVDGECEVTWTNDDVVAPTSVAKASLATGLVYAYTKRPTWWGVSAWYLTAARHPHRPARLQRPHRHRHPDEQPLRRDHPRPRRVGVHRDPGRHGAGQGPGLTQLARKHRSVSRSSLLIGRREWSRCRRDPQRENPMPSSKKPADGFTEDERAAIKERAQEVKAARKRGGGKADGEADLLAKIAEMEQPDRGDGRAGPRRRHGQRRPSSSRRPGTACRRTPWTARSCASSRAPRSSRRGTRRSASTTPHTSTTGTCGRPRSPLTDVTKAVEKKIAALVKQAVS